MKERVKANFKILYCYSTTPDLCPKIHHFIPLFLWQNSMKAKRDKGSLKELMFKFIYAT
jgi:hypothetical protein